MMNIPNAYRTVFAVALLLSGASVMGIKDEAAKREIRKAKDLTFEEAEALKQEFLKRGCSAEALELMPTNEPLCNCIEATAAKVFVPCLVKSYAKCTVAYGNHLIPDSTDPNCVVIQFRKCAAKMQALANAQRIEQAETPATGTGEAQGSVNNTDKKNA